MFRGLLVGYIERLLQAVCHHFSLDDWKTVFMLPNGPISLQACIAFTVSNHFTQCRDHLLFDQHSLVTEHVQVLDEQVFLNLNVGQLADAKHI